MPPFEIPESVKAYFSDPATRAVVDSLIPALDDPFLPDMDRNNLVDLSEGVLVSCQVRADFIRFMAGLWANTFGVGLETCGLQDEFSSDCTIKEIWTEKQFWSSVTVDGNLGRHSFVLTARVGNKRPNEVKLQVWLLDENDAVYLPWQHLGVPEGWKQSEDEEDDPFIEAVIEVKMADLIANPGEELRKLLQVASGVVSFIGGLKQP